MAKSFTSTFKTAARLAAIGVLLAGCSQLPVGLGGTQAGNSITVSGNTLNLDTAQKVTIERSALETRVVANGKVIPRSVGIVSFPRAGQVMSKTVSLGDLVKAGQIMARQDTTELENTLKSQEQSFLSSLASYSQTIKPVDERDVLQARSAISSAQFSLNNAWVSYNNAVASIKNAEVSVSNAQSGVQNAQTSVQNAQSSSGSAQASFDELAKGPTESTVSNALSSWNSAKNSLWSSQISRDAACGQRNREGDVLPSCKTAEAGVGNAIESERRAYQAYLDAQKGATADKILASQSSVTSAQNSVKTAENGVKTAENAVKTAETGVTTARNNAQSAFGNVQSAQINLENSKIKLDALLNPSNAENAIIAKTRLDQAQLSLDQAKANIEKTVLVAPMDGVITTMSFEIGDYVGGGSKIMEVTANDRPLFEVDVDEADIGSVRLGQESRVQLQAFSNTPISATVEYIAPAAVSTNNTTNVKVRLALGQLGNPAAAGGFAGGQGGAAAVAARATAIAQGTPAAALGGPGGQGAQAGQNNPAAAARATAIAQGTPAASLPAQGGPGGQGGAAGQQRQVQIPRVLLGMTGTADIIANRVDNIIQVPNRALIVNRTTRALQVWRATADGKAELITVTAGQRGQSSTAVATGLEVGDVILIPAASTAAAGGQQGGFGGGGAGIPKAPGP